MATISAAVLLLCLCTALLSSALHLPVHKPRESDINVCVNATDSDPDGSRRQYWVGSVPYCEYFNTTRRFNVTRYVVPYITEPKPVVLLTNVSLEVTNSTSDTSAPLQLVLAMQQCAAVNVTNSTLHAPHLWIYVNCRVSIDRSSHLSVDGFAPSGLPDNPLPGSNATSGYLGGGGGSGGVGGVGCHDTSRAAVGGAACGDPVTPPAADDLMFGGPGSVAVSNSSASDDDTLGFGIGGGFIQVQVGSADLVIDGAITADGTDGWHATLPAGGGGGGFIALYAEGLVTSTPGTSGLVSASGGSGIGGGGGGAGGRIYIAAGGGSNVDVRAYGGNTGTAAQTCSTPAQGGGQGTIYIMTTNSSGTVTTSSVELSCIGLDGDLATIAPTDFSNSSTVDRLTLSNCRLAATPLVQLTASLSVYNSILEPSAAAARPRCLRIVSPYIQTGSKSVISADVLSISTAHLELGSATYTNEKILFRDSAVINSSSVINVFGHIEVAEDATTPLLTLLAPSISLQPSSQVTAYVVEIAATTVTAAGSITASYQRVDVNCSTAVPHISESTCAAVAFSFATPQWQAWASLVIASRSVHLGSDTLSGGVLVLCSDTVSIDHGGTLSTNAMGCRDNGFGRGTQPDGGGPAGGGGHGGDGGPAIPPSVAANVAVAKSSLPGGAGMSYDNGSMPCMVGSSGGYGGSTPGTGGNGGGLIYLEAYVLILAGASSIRSDGGNAQTEESGSGGGSGGTVVLRLGSIAGPSSGPAAISAVGGMGLGSTLPESGGSGGGGGGGRILVQWTGAPPMNQQDAIVFQVLPGNGTLPGSTGQPGSALSDPACGPGYSGLLCVSCPVGSFKNVSGPSECLPCVEGSFSNATNATACALCNAGTVPNCNRTGCVSCEVGFISHAGDATCTACGPGYESTERHTECTQCAMGQYKGKNDTVCRPCPVGQYSNAQFDDCDRCPDPPAHSHYVSLVGAKCQYECDVGFLQPNCETPFWSMVNSMGGVLVFAAFLALSLAVTFVPFLCCFIRSKRRQREREILEMDDAETDSEAESLPPSPPSAAGRTFTASPSYDHPAITSSLLLEHGAPTLSLKELPATSLQPRHLPHHLHRIYLHGNNSFYQPFELSALVPIELSQIVFDNEYADFAALLSELGQWSRLEYAAYVLLLVLCFPVASYFLHLRRRAHVMRLWQYVLNYDHSMLRNAKSRALASSLLFGSSSCHTLAWIDVLATTSEEKLQADGATGLPRLPLVLIASGDGSYHTPFHFDVSDAYVKCVSDYVGMNWHKFVRGVNSHIRCVRLSAVHSQAALAPALQFLRVENHMGIGIGKHLPLGGVKVELGWIAEEAGVGGSVLPALVVSAKEESGSMSVSSSPHAGKSAVRASGAGPALMPRSQLLQVHQPTVRRDDRSPQSSDSGRDAAMLSQSYTSSSYLTSDEDEDAVPSIMERALGQNGKQQVESYLRAKKQLEAEQRRLQKKLSSSYASLPGREDDGHEQPSTSSAYRAFGRMGAFGKGAADVADVHVGSKKKKGAAQPAVDRRDSLPATAERKEDLDASVGLDTSMIIADAYSPPCLPYYACTYHFGTSPSQSSSATPARIRRLFSLNSPKAGTAATSQSSAPARSDDLRPPAVSLPYRLQGLFLFNVPLYLSRTMVACVFLFLLFMRLALSLIVLSSSFQLVRWLFDLSVSLYPMAPALIPLLGITALVSSSTHACRFFACSVLLSLLNDLVVVVGSICALNTSLGYIDAILLPALALASSVLLLFTAHAYVAHLETLKDLVLGRRQATAKDEQDPAFSGGLITNQSPPTSRKGSRRSSLQHAADEGADRDKRKVKQRRSKGSAAPTEQQPPPESPSTGASQESVTPLQVRDEQTQTAPMPTQPVDPPLASAAVAVPLSSPVPVPLPPPPALITPRSLSLLSSSLSSPTSGAGSPAVSAPRTVAAPSKRRPKAARPSNK